MYTPDPKSNIGQLYAVIPSNKALTAQELYQIVSNINPDFPQKSTNTHLRFLCQKGVVFKQIFEGLNYFSRSKQPESETRQETKRLTLGDQILNYCKEHVGKQITSNQVKEHINAQNTGYLDILKRLSDANAIQAVKNTKPWSYLILPDIKALDKVPTKREIAINDSPSIIHKQETLSLNDSTIKNNIANMSLGDILSEYVVLKQENIRLRAALERMGMEFIQLGILEGD